MAEKLVNYYSEAQKIGGMKAKLRLHLLTGVSASQASSEPDNSDNVAKFQKAIEEIKKEF